MATQAAEVNTDVQDVTPTPASEAFDKLADDILGPDDEEEEETGDEENADEGEGDEDDGAEEGEDAAAEEIEPPNSLTDAEKEAFKALPLEGKKFVTRRIGELERAFHAKAQEVANVRQASEMEALRFAEQLQAQTAQALSYYAEQLKPQMPDARLARTDPASYAYMMQNYHEANAQREQAQQQAQQALQQQQAYQAELQRQEEQTYSLRLQSELPELFDPANGQALINELSATASALGFDPAQITDVTALKALKVTSEWKTKAAKYDAAMARRAAPVSDKRPTPTAKPGTPKGAGRSRASKAAAARAAMNNAKGDARTDAFGEWAENVGLL